MYTNTLKNKYSTVMWLTLIITVAIIVQIFNNVLKKRRIFSYKI